HGVDSREATGVEAEAVSARGNGSRGALGSLRAHGGRGDGREKQRESHRRLADSERYHAAQGTADVTGFTTSPRLQSWTLDTLGTPQSSPRQPPKPSSR